MDEYIGTIKYFAFTFAPDGWFPCDGRLLYVTQYQALFSLIDYTYGGEFNKTFALPSIPTKMGATSGPVGYCICYNGLYPPRP